MATKTLSNDFMQRIADEGAWKELSNDLCWTEHLLEKYQDKIDWNELSRYADEKVLTENCIETS